MRRACDKINSMNRLSKAILALSIAGLALASYSLAHKTGFTSGALCDINATFNCDVVNRGPYSEVMGIPVALLGVLGYVFFGLAAALKLRQPQDKNLTSFLFYSTFFGLLFTLYLTGLEFFVLHAFCIVCLASQVTMLALFTCVARVAWLEEHPVRGLFARFFSRKS